MDSEKVIKGLEHCTNGRNGCFECPYSEDGFSATIYCKLQIDRDALALLKEQDETIKELQNAYGYLQKLFFEAQDKLLKEQEAVKPYIDIDEAKCPICKVKLTRQELLGDDVLFEDFYDYCPHCGRSVKWE